ncbi:MAG: Molybdenum cofactor biosynthesis protein B [Alphaproteobacteria bacterium MarineAlpha9_Bin3]|nr:MAG: Molybdenum cofactor biosynthesis protein B [Alphaproteobacteria bacterium MarineAlpha9_Bin3]|tara:strand:- start:1019 stop:1561 length:543 start_codon:yes stop_codon:yes gene_type:complete
MLGIDKDRAFKAVNIALLTVSDTRSLENDKSGSTLQERILKAGHKVYDRFIVKDDIIKIKNILVELINNREVDVVITTGGTGITGRDLTPEVFNEILEKEIPGFGELFRWLSYKKIATSTIQSRAMAGVTKGTYLFSLPGSVGACKDAWDDILVHQLDYRHRPCNLVELMPRLREHEEDV